MNNGPISWSPDEICLRGTPTDVRTLAADVHARTLRVGFDAPGFCVVNVGRGIDAAAFRGMMVSLTRAMAAIHEASTGDTLAYLSAGRFDQQATTRPHLDGGPDECFLMLGYEPSAVDSELEIFDYARCAHDHGLSPKDFLGRYNPMFAHGYEVLRPYATRVPCFDRADYRIVCINNSCAPYSDSDPAWQGVLHTATVTAPDAALERVINSTMIAPVPAGTPDRVGPDELAAFAG